MADSTITTFAEYHDVVMRYTPLTDVFRGESDARRDLLPKIARPSMRFRGSVKTTEKELLRMFKERALPYLNFQPRNDWEWLAVAQHHGMATRLLDCTRNPLMAAYFACEADVNADGVVYVLKEQIFIDLHRYPDPFSYTSVGKFVPPNISERISAQASVFTVHPDPSAPVEHSNVDRIFIKSTARRQVRHVLYRYGIHRESVFPGLDGLSYHLNWLRRGRADSDA